MIEPKGRKPEDTASGCRDHAAHDRDEAAGELNPRMRARLVSSADTWTKRANLLARLESSRDGDEAGRA